MFQPFILYKQGCESSRPRDEDELDIKLTLGFRECFIIRCIERTPMSENSKSNPSRSPPHCLLLFALQFLVYA